LTVTQITPQLLQQWLSDSGRKPPVLLDVREPWEYQTCRIEGSTLAPMNTSRRGRRNSTPAPKPL
jgi:rhodanese-related sulfurtransferase